MQNHAHRKSFTQSVDIGTFKFFEGVDPTEAMDDTPYSSWIMCLRRALVNGDLLGVRSKTPCDVRSILVGDPN